METNRVTEIDLYKIRKGLKKSYKLILVFCLVFLLLGIVISTFFIKQSDEYKATSSVYSIVYGSISDSTTSLHAMLQYSDIVKSNKVAERAAMILGDPSISKNDIYKMIYTSSDSDTLKSSSKLYINAVATDKSVAIKVANAVADAFVLEISSMTGENDIQTLDKADDAVRSYSVFQTKIKIIFLMSVSGLLCAILYVGARETLSHKMYSPKDATLYGELDIIGVIPVFNSKRENKRETTPPHS